MAKRLADGTPLLGLEPRCLLTLVDEWTELLPGAQTKTIAAGGTAAALRLVPQLDVTVLDSGCCGMAGSFGFEREHYDLSVQIANLALLPALETAPEALVAAPGTSCRHQIKDLALRHALHPVEVLEEQLVETSDSIG